MRKRAREAKAAEAALTEAQGEHERCEAEVCAIAKEVQQRVEGMRVLARCACDPSAHHAGVRTDGVHNRVRL